MAELINTTEAARIGRCSLATVYRAVKDGSLRSQPVTGVGKTLVFKEDVVIRWAKGKKQNNDG